MFYSFPVLFKDRWKVLDHLFLIVGNGYEWHDGELIDSKELYEYDAQKDERVISSIYTPHSDGPDIKKAIQCYRSGKTDDMCNIIINITNQRRRELGRPELDPNTRVWSYDTSSNRLYEAIFNIPSNITPEWQQLVNELKQALLEDGIDIDNNTVTAEGEKHLSSFYRI